MDPRRPGVGVRVDGTGAAAGQRMLTMWTTHPTGEGYGVLAWIEPVR